jgi:uncharacterized membrane protein YsdA (DUF1294 family)
VITLIQNDDQKSAKRLRKRATLTRKRLILLGALTGSVGAFLMSAVFLGGLGLIFSLPDLLVTMTLGAFFGTIVTLIADKHEASRWIMLAVAALVGLITPICLIQILFLLVRPD